MNSEKILVVYFSRSGNTRSLANEIARDMDADIQEITTKVNYEGVIGYQKALMHTLFNKRPVINSLNKNIDDYDMIVIGSPVWGGRVPPPVRSFIDRYKNDFKKIAFFVTQKNSYGRKRFFNEIKLLTKKFPVTQLSISLKDIVGGQSREKIKIFVNEIKLSMPRVEKGRAKVHPKTQEPPTVSH